MKILKLADKIIFLSGGEVTAWTNDRGNAKLLNHSVPVNSLDKTSLIIKVNYIRMEIIWDY